MVMPFLDPLVPDTNGVSSGAVSQCGYAYFGPTGTRQFSGLSSGAVSQCGNTYL